MKFGDESRPPSPPPGPLPPFFGPSILTEIQRKPGAVKNIYFTGNINENDAYDDKDENEQHSPLPPSPYLLPPTSFLLLPPDIVDTNHALMGVCELVFVHRE